MELLDRHKHTVLSLFRIVVSLMFVCHGAAILFGAFGTKHVPTFGTWPGWWAGAIEFFGGILVLLGLGTRIAALICSGAMAYAYFTVHQKIALWPIENEGELAALYSWIFLMIAFVGPGNLTLAALFKLGRRAEAPKQTVEETASTH